MEKAWRGRKKRWTVDFRARLECGCVIRLRQSPFTPLAKYGCNAGLGHGYNLWWVETWSADDPDAKEANGAYLEMKERGEGEWETDSTETQPPSD